MNRRLTLSIALGALLAARAASAQEVAIGYAGLPYKHAGETQNSGIQISDGVLMHVGAGAEAGYDSNVFYSDPGSGVIGSGIIRVSSYAEFTNATRSGVTPSGLSFDARAGLQYRRYTSTDAALNNYHDAFMPSAGLSLSTSAGSTFSFGFSDSFLRTEDTPYAAGQGALTRDNNQASAEVRWAPGGGRINTVLRYTNMVDIYENTYSYANALTQDLMLDASWKWLPKTAVFVQARQGYISYFNDSPTTLPKYSSYPLRLIVGLRGLITEKISAVASAGYVNGLYSCTPGPNCVNTGGIWGSTYANVELTYRPTLLGRVVLGYRHDFQNSVISAFYYGDQVYASFVQQVAGRFALDLSGRFLRKDYQGYSVGNAAVARIDNTFQAGATFDYFMRNWAYAGIGYALLANSSDPSVITQGTAVVPLNYVKHQVFARLGLTY